MISDFKEIGKYWYLFHKFLKVRNGKDIILLILGGLIVFFILFFLEN
jgi:TM2 domain-containing membrane protein YozV